MPTMVSPAESPVMGVDDWMTLDWPLLIGLAAVEEDQVVLAVHSQNLHERGSIVVVDVAGDDGRAGRRPGSDLDGVLVRTLCRYAV